MAEEQKDETVEVVETVTEVVEAPADTYSKEELATLTSAWRSGARRRHE
ncbi:MAG: hypothetical protein R2855_06295 [Thermomicrobiales bacterium]